MKRPFVFLLLAAFLLLSGCAFSYIVPEKAVPVDMTQLSAVKIPLKAAVVLPDEGYTLTKTWINPQAESVQITLTVPFGKLMKNASQTVFPALFEQATAVSGKSAPAGTDIVYTPSIKDFFFEFGGAGPFEQTLTVRMHLNNKVTDAAGKLVFSDETATETQKNYPMSFSESDYLGVQADVMASAVNDALLKAARALADSGEIQMLAKSRSGSSSVAVQQAAEPAGSTAQAPADLPMLRNKLKDAFEKGAITAEQLSRALEEGRRTPRSKILEAFLEDKIDAKKFGELY